MLTIFYLLPIIDSKKVKNMSIKAVYWIPLLLLLLITPFSTSLDLSIGHYFYPTENQTAALAYEYIFHYLAVLTWIALALVVILLILSYVSEKYRKWRLPAWYLITTFVIGSGLIVHLVLKDHWGRPRPKQTIEFGGEVPYRAFYQPDFSNKGREYKSFPCGHCSVGFYFFSFMVLGRRLNRKSLYYSGMIAAIIIGTAFGIARMGQGGHFFSDIVVCAIIMWWTAWIFDHLFFDYARKDERANKTTA